MRKTTTNPAYHLDRRVLMTTLGLPLDVPKGKTGEWENVEVRPGYPWGAKQFSIILPKVRLMAEGVANRVQVLCPCCFSTWVRACALQQHAGTRKCEEANRARLVALDEERRAALPMTTGDVTVESTIITYKCERTLCGYKWDGASGTYANGPNRPLCPDCRGACGVPTGEPTPDPAAPTPDPAAPDPAAPTPAADPARGV